MADLHLTHIALVGARIGSFAALGFTAREEFAMHRVVPPGSGKPMADTEPALLQAILREQLPIWIHNIIRDPAFPARQRLLMPLRRFEGELIDNKTDEVVSTVLSCGFRNQEFDPLRLPHDMKTRERVAIVAHLKVWQDAYQTMERDLVAIMVEQAAAIDHWCERVSSEDCELEY